MPRLWTRLSNESADAARADADRLEAEFQPRPPAARVDENIGILARMIRRLCAAAVALAVTAAPVPGYLCEARCAQHVLHGSHTAAVPPHGEGPIHDHVAATPHPVSDSLTVHALHACGDLTLLSTAPRSAAERGMRAAVSATDLTPTATRTWNSEAIETHHGPPGPGRSRLPLRI